eukprot:XP_025983715.1 uncharacterized protein LOC100802379 isoform X3 [Glycine max]
MIKETSNGTGNVAITEISERFALREAQKFPFLKGQVLITVQCFEFFHAQITFMSLKRDFDAIRYYVVAVINYQLDCRDAKRRRPGDENYDSRTLYLPPDFLRSLSYAQKQWWEFKSKHMDKVLFFKMGKFYELFEMDAHVGEKELDLQYMKGDQPHCGFPEKNFSMNLEKLARKDDSLPPPPPPPPPAFISDTELINLSNKPTCN